MYHWEEAPAPEGALLNAMFIDNAGNFCSIASILLEVMATSQHIAEMYDNGVEETGRCFSTITRICTDLDYWAVLYFSAILNICVNKCLFCISWRHHRRIFQ